MKTKLRRWPLWSERLARLLDFLEANPGPHSMSEVARAMGMDYGPAQHALFALEKWEIVKQSGVRGPNNKWQWEIGDRFAVGQRGAKVKSTPPDWRLPVAIAIGEMLATDQYPDGVNAFDVLRWCKSHDIEIGQEIGFFQVEKFIRSLHENKS